MSGFNEGDNHNLTITKHAGLLILDSFVVFGKNSDNESPPSSTSSSSPAPSDESSGGVSPPVVARSVVGSVVGLLAMILIVFLICRYRKHRRNEMTKVQDRLEVPRRLSGQPERINLRIEKDMAGARRRRGAIAEHMLDARPTEPEVQPIVRPPSIVPNGHSEMDTLAAGIDTLVPGMMEFLMAETHILGQDFMLSSELLTLSRQG